MGQYNYNVNFFSFFAEP